MRLPGWLDRERRIRELKIISETKVDAAQMWWRHYQRSLKDQHELRIELAKTTAELATLREALYRLEAENERLRNLLAKHEGATP